MSGSNIAPPCLGLAALRLRLQAFEQLAEDMGLASTDELAEEENLKKVADILKYHGAWLSSPLAIALARRPPPRTLQPCPHV